MKLLENANIYLKENVYDFYCSIVQKPKQYERITRKKMFEEILKVYDAKMIIDLCTVDELKELEEIVTDKSKSKFVMNSLMYHSLFEKYFIHFDCSIYDELQDLCKEAIKIVDFKEKQKQQDDLATLLGYCRVNGAVLETIFDALIQLYFTSSYTKEDVINHLMLKKYLKKEPYHIASLDKDTNRYIWKDYENVIDQLDKNRASFAIGSGAFKSKEFYQSIFYYGYDQADLKVKKFFDLLEKKRVLPVEIKRIFIYSLLGGDWDNLKPHYELFYGFKSKEFEIMDDAMERMPMGALNGMSFLEYEEEIEKREELESQKESYQKQGRAHLDEKDVKLFYRLYFSLLDYINRKYNIKPHIDINPYLPQDPNDFTEVIDKLWENKEELIDEYCAKNPLKLSRRNLRIVEDFKNGFFGNFFIVKFEKNHTIFYDDDHVYMVKGLNVNIDEVINPSSLPCGVQTALIPFNGEIVYDSILRSVPVSIGPNSTQRMLEEIEEKDKVYTLSKTIIH